MYSKFDDRVNELLSKMSLSEKIGQLNQIGCISTEEDFEKVKNLIIEGKVGSVIIASSATAGNDYQGRIDVELYNKIQRVAVEQSPNHIPLIFGRDVIHGHKTVYPVPLASAASFNPSLIEKCYRNIAKEASNNGVHWTFSPMIDMSRDPRWGRIAEGPGEDPYVGSCMAKACVKGFQGDDLGNPESLVACAKHYIGYGASEGGRDYHRTEISDYSLYNYYLPAFRAAVDAGVGTVMSSFNDVNGKPITATKKYLKRILRDELGFDGFVVSDWNSVAQVCVQKVASSRAEAARLSLESGLDMDMTSDCYIENLENLVNENKISEKEIDEAVSRVLKIKFACGLFDMPYCKMKKIDRKEHIKDARKLAGESMVLLKNENVLPLKKNKKVALIGPMATERRSLLGTWCLDGVADETQNFAEALTEAIGEENTIVSDCNLALFDGSNYKIGSADVFVLALGESDQMTGEARAVSDISLNSLQIELINKIRSFGKKVVGVFFCGRPIAMQGVAENLDAILYAWHSGSEAAHAVCDILFGDVVPSGKTAVTFPRKSGHIPMYYNVTSNGRWVNCYYGENPEKCYVDSIATPYYPFGYGLSYTTFEYSLPIAEVQEMSLSDLKNNKKFKFTVTVKNTGDYDGKEVVELYIRDCFATSMRPLRELKAFEKVLIKKNEEKEITFELGYDKLGFYDEDGNYLVEAGDFEIFVGPDCLTENKITVKVTD